MKGIESEEFSSFASKSDDHANAPEHPTDANTTSALERGNGGDEEEEKEEEEEAVRAAQPGTRNETREERKKEKQSVGVEGKNQNDGLRRRRSGRGKNDAKEDKDDDNDVDAHDDPNKKLERPRGKRPPMENFIGRGHLKDDERGPFGQTSRLDQGDFQLIRDLGLHADGLGREGRVVQTCVEIKFPAPHAPRNCGSSMA